MFPNYYNIAHLGLLGHLILSFSSSKALPVFCCAQREHLCKLLLKQRCLVERRYELGTGSDESEEDKATTGLEEMLCYSRQMEDRSKFIMDSPRGLGYKFSNSQIPFSFYLAQEGGGVTGLS